MKNFLSKFFYPILILILVGFLAWKNYSPGIILSGWDTLHPEFNFSLYLKRIFYGVWQEHQGVGAVASQSHAAELSRLPVIWLESLFLPTNLIRYTFFFLCIAVGALGVFFLSKYLLQKHAEKFTRTPAFLASAFYILNLTTVQQFSVPLEMFAVHFAVIPWLFYWAIRFVREGRRKNLFWFCIATVFSSSMAHTATLYYVYIVALGLFLLSICLLGFSKDKLKKSVVILGFTFLLNAYWILPNLYFVKNHGLEVANSKIHSSFSDEAFLQSENYGDIEDLVLQKNFLFNWRAFDYSKDGFTNLLGTWQDHLNRPYVVAIGYSLFALGVFGFLFALLKKEKYFLSFFLPLTLCVVFWINANGPLKPVFEQLRDSLMLFREALRFPFTKFSIILVFILSLYMAFALQNILRFINKIKLGYVLAFIVLIANIYFALPAFKGYLVASNVKVSIPDQYFQVFKWFSARDPNARVAKLPMNTMWGWNYYSWHYEGAGFTWFGIPQATFDREFDRWSRYNEDFYAQSAFALFANDGDSFEKTLEKYRVKYLLLDESITNPGQDAETLHIGEIKNLISVSKNIKQVVNFGFLTVYDTGLDISNGYLSTPVQIAKVNANLNYAEVDNVYKKYGDYIEDASGASFPFVNFNKLGDVKMYADGDSIVFENKQTGDKVASPSGSVVREDLSINRGFPSAYNCDLDKLGKVEKIQNIEGVTYKATGNGVSCDYLNFSDFLYTQAYVLHIVGENKVGRSLKIYFYNHATGKMDVEEVLPKGAFDQYYFIYPKNIEGGGYTLNFETRSYGRIASENLLSKVEFYPVDSNYLQTFEGQTLQGIQNNLKILNVQKYGTWAYKVKTDGGGLLELGQGYDGGWRAFPTLNYQFSIFNFQSSINVPIFKQELKHVKVNSWANGWLVVDSKTVNQLNSSSVFIFFWPQLLEWGGGMIGLATLLVLILKRRKGKGVPVDMA